MRRTHKKKNDERTKRDRRDNIQDQHTHTRIHTNRRVHEKSRQPEKAFATDSLVKRLPMCVLSAVHARMSSYEYTPLPHHHHDNYYVLVCTRMNMPKRTQTSRTHTYATNTAVVRSSSCVRVLVGINQYNKCRTADNRLFHFLALPFSTRLLPAAASPSHGSAFAFLSSFASTFSSFSLASPHFTAFSCNHVAPRFFRLLAAPSFIWPPAPLRRSCDFLVLLQFSRSNGAISVRSAATIIGYLLRTFVMPYFLLLLPLLYVSSFFSFTPIVLWPLYTPPPLLIGVKEHSC